VTITRIGFVPSAPLLIPDVAGGAANADELLRAACSRVVADLTQPPTRHVIVLAPALIRSAIRQWPGTATWTFDGFGVARHLAPTDVALPWPLGIGAWLLDEAHWDGARRYVEVGEIDEDIPDRPAPLSLAAEPTAVVAIGDGSARRSEKAPGHFDSRAQDFDDTVAAALSAGDSRALVGLDGTLAVRVVIAHLALRGGVLCRGVDRPPRRHPMSGHSSRGGRSPVTTSAHSRVGWPSR
jgi:hypothetical protein